MKTEFFFTEWAMIGSYDTATDQLSCVTSTILDFQDSYHEFEASPDAKLIKIPGDFNKGTYFYNIQAAEIVQGMSVQKSLHNQTQEKPFT